MSRIIKKGRRQRRRFEPDAYPINDRAELPGPAADVVRILEPLLTERRAKRIDGVLAHRTRSVVPVLEGVIDPHNISAILRSADAFGLQEVHGIRGDKPFRASKRIARGTDQWVELRKHVDTESCIASLRERGYPVFVAAMDGDKSLQDLRALPKVALVFGNEHKGLTEDALGGADGTFAVPMHGFVESLNVSVAAAVTLHTVRGDRPGDLTAEDHMDLKARFLMYSVRDARRVVDENLERTSSAEES